VLKCTKQQQLQEEKKTWTTKEHLETVTATCDGGAIWQVALIQPTENPDKNFNQVQYCHVH